MKRNEIRNLVWVGVFGGLGLVLPILFHMIGLGSAFLPMFVPFAVASCILPFGSICFLACVVPFLSFLFTGMPPLVPPVVFLMIVEGMALGSTLWFTVQIRKWTVWLSTLIGLAVFISARILFISITAPIFGFSGMVVSLVSMLHGLPGFLLILITVPVSVKFIHKQHINITV